jgi:Ser/Thr protein kinase RdoA (MazF antagonist)
MTLASVLAHYGLRPADVQPVGGTAGGSWKVSVPPACYFVRRRGKRTATEERTRFDLGLRRFLAERGFPTQSPLRAASGDDHVRLGGDVYELYRWVDGELLDPRRRAEVQEPVVALLADFHKLAAAYPARCESVVPQFSLHACSGLGSTHFDDPRIQAQVLELIRSGEEDGNTLRQFDQALDRVRWLSSSYGPLLAALPRYTIHGDFTSANVLFAPSGEIAGLFDFDWAWRDTRIRDVADGALFFGAEWATGLDPADIWSLTSCPRLDTSQMAAFIEAYGRELPLSRAERRGIPFAILARWVSMRLENAPKAPPHRRTQFLLKEFAVPFEWYETEGRRLAS